MREGHHSETVDDLAERIRIQNGESATLPPDGADWNKVVWHETRFGAPVTIESSTYPTARGYLTTLPGRHDVDCDGVIHLPTTWGEKCDAGPVWITLMDCTAMPDVTRIVIGEEPRKPNS